MYFLYFDITFFSSYLKYFLIRKTSILRTNIFLKSTVETNPRLALSHFNAAGCRLWSTGNERSQWSVVNSIQEESSETVEVRISRTEYIMKCYHNMVDQIPQKRILRPWNQWEVHCLHRRPHIWNSRTSGAPRHQDTKELPLEQKLNLHQVGDPIEIHTDLFKYRYIYHMCRTRHLLCKGQRATEIQLLNTPHDRRRCRQAMTLHWCSSINMLCFPQKTGACTFATGGGGDSDTCHQDYVVTWQRLLQLLSN